VQCNVTQFSFFTFSPILLVLLSIFGKFWVFFPVGPTLKPRRCNFFNFFDNSFRRFRKKYRCPDISVVNYIITTSTLNPELRFLSWRARVHSHTRSLSLSTIFLLPHVFSFLPHLPHDRESINSFVDLRVDVFISLLPESLYDTLCTAIRISLASFQFCRAFACFVYTLYSTN
jgi:hypothetical protein